MKIWNMESLRHIGNLPINSRFDVKKTRVDFSPNGSKIVILMNSFFNIEYVFLVWDINGHRWICKSLIHNFLSRGPWDRGRCDRSVAFSYDERVMVIRFDDAILLWDTESNCQIGETFIVKNRVKDDYAVSPDGTKKITYSFDNALLIWDIESQRQIGAPLEGHTQRVLAAGWSSNGRIIISDSYDSVRIWDVESRLQIGEPLEKIYCDEPLFYYSDSYRYDRTKYVFNRDGSKYIDALANGTLRIWDSININFQDSGTN